jgi:hypothetical protein
MDPHTEPDNPWWHSLMYSTAILLLVCGVPGTLIALLVIANRSDATVSWSQSLTAGGWMIGAVVSLALVLFAVAKAISSRMGRRR